MRAGALLHASAIIGAQIQRRRRIEHKRRGPVRAGQRRGFPATLAPKRVLLLSGCLAARGCGAHPRRSPALECFGDPTDGCRDECFERDRRYECLERDSTGTCVTECASRDEWGECE